MKQNNYTEKFKNIKYKDLGKTGFKVSICGFGSYRVDYRVKEHSEALEYALKKGINLIDTSANYSDGGSEILIGNVLNSLISKKELDRNDIIVVSKGGYIQGNNMLKAKEREKEGNPYPEIVNCAPDLWHCIHPEFLSDQITLSLERLKQDYIDIYLLHNPEYFLTYTNTSDEEQLRNEYYRRIRKAFEYLEEEVKKGRIRYYGISSNTFGEDDSKRNFTSLERILEQVPSENHFAVVQFPLNLLEKGGVSTFLELAARSGLGVLVNRPLNAIVKNKLRRLADLEIKENRTIQEINDLIDDLSRMEDSIKKGYIMSLKINEPEKNNILEAASLSSFLKSAINRFENVSHFIEIKGQYLIPRANYAVNETYKYNINNREAVSRLNKYAIAVNITLDSIESHFAKEANKNNEGIHSLLSDYITGSPKELTLSQKSILMINSLPEVSCTLVGMRNKKYVDDVLGSISADYIPNAKEFWRSEDKG